MADRHVDAEGLGGAAGRITGPHVQLAAVGQHARPRPRSAPAGCRRCRPRRSAAATAARSAPRRRPRRRPVTASSVSSARAAWPAVSRSTRGVAREHVELVAGGEVGVQEVVGVHRSRPRLDQPQLVVRGSPTQATEPESHRVSERELASGRPGRMASACATLPALVQQVPDRQVRRQAGPPVAAEHQVQADRETVAVHPEVAEQAAEAEHQGPSRCAVEADVQHRDLVVQVAVEVHGLGQHRPAGRPAVRLA